MTDTPATPDEMPPDITAAELALGLLDGDERADAMRRQLNDRAFAADVERWQLRLGAMAEAAGEVAPPANVLRRVETSLFSPSAVSTPGRFWPIATAVAGLAAAVLLILLIARPASPVRPVPHAASSAILAAAIEPSGSGPAIVALYDAAHATIRVGRSPVTDASQSAELWVIAGKAPPRPLGLMTGAASQLTVTGAARGALTAGVTLAISREPAGGSKTGLPTGPVIATGVLAPV